MDKEVKELWLTALRSGEYQQGKGYLKLDYPNGSVGYCCLGVLTNIASQLGVCNKLKKDDRNRWLVSEQVFPGTEFEWSRSEGAYLLGSVKDWSGVDLEDQFALADINDGSSDFDKVIEYIEDKL